MLAYRGESRRKLSSSLLTKREQEVLAYLSEGNEYQDIADVLGISVNGIRAHIKRIYRKLNVTNSIQAARLYWEYTHQKQRAGYVSRKAPLPTLEKVKGN